MSGTPDPQTIPLVVRPLPAETLRLAARCVRRHVPDLVEQAEILRMLGLTEYLHDHTCADAGPAQCARLGERTP